MHNVGVFIIAIFEILVFVVAVFSMDFTDHSGNFIKLFGFECKKGEESVWWIGKTFKSGTTWELHFMIIFIYTTVSLIVLSTIPYKYDRFVKTEKEIEADAKKEEKAKKKKEERKKRKRKTRATVSGRLTTALPNFTFGIKSPVRPQSSGINGLEISPSKLNLN